MIFVDSNIWCYYFDKSSKEHKAVARILERSLQREKIVINTIVIMEVAHFLIKNLHSESKKKINLFLGFPMRIIDFNFDQLRLSLNLLVEHSQLGIGGRDATLLAAMKKINARKILTHDKAFRKVRGIKVIDPIK